MIILLFVSLVVSLVISVVVNATLMMDNRKLKEAWNRVTDLLNNEREQRCVAEVERFNALCTPKIPSSTWTLREPVRMTNEHGFPVWAAFGAERDGEVIEVGKVMTQPAIGLAKRMERARRNAEAVVQAMNGEQPKGTE